ncbi:MAG: DegT/DnrJ/EryC1/StrS family aminotransferase [Methylococcales bacterium]
MAMQFIDLKAQQRLIREQIEVNIKKVLDHGKYILGPENAELEEKLADFVGVKHCIGVSSGTDALLIAMLALGVRAGDEVITTPFTFIATGEMIALLGAKPIFVDIDSRTHNIDANKIQAAITTKTKAIMPVSLYGQCADFEQINAIAEQHEIAVIEDGCQSFGATYKGGASCGLSTIGCTSFFPSKPLGGYGDSGACFTDDNNLAKRMREISLHGQDRRYHHPRIGINGRMDTLQAAILLAKFEVFADEVKARSQLGAEYTAMIRAKQHLADKTAIVAPFIETWNTSVYAQYTIQVDNREQIQKRLESAQIPSAVHYPVPLNQQPALLTEEFELPVSERLSNKVISLPMHPYLKQEQQQCVIQALFSE